MWWAAEWRLEPKIETISDLNDDDAGGKEWKSIVFIELIVSAVDTRC